MSHWSKCLLCVGVILFWAQCLCSMSWHLLLCCKHHCSFCARLLYLLNPTYILGWFCVVVWRMSLVLQWKRQWICKLLRGSVHFNSMDSTLWACKHFIVSFSIYFIHISWFTLRGDPSQPWFNLFQGILLLFCKCDYNFFLSELAVNI